MAAAAAAAVSGLHQDIEVTTRRLEIEKRRLHRLERELALARHAYEKKVGLEPKRGTQADASQCEQPTKPAGRSARPPRSAREPAGPLRRGHRPTSRPRSVPPVSSTGEATSGKTQPEDFVPCRTLVGRLETQMKKLDALRHDIEGLRVEINSVRQHRLLLNGIFERVRVEIKQRSAQLADFVEEGEASKGVRQQAKVRVAVVQRQQELERANFKAQVTRIRREMETTDHERKEIEVQLKRATEGVQRKKELTVPEEEHGAFEDSMMRRIIKTAFLNCIQRRHIKQHQENIEVFEQAFSTIKQSTGISNIEEIVRIFINLESRNFSLLTYVNHMNREIEVLEGARRWREATKQTRRIHEKESDQQRREALGEVRRQLQATSKAVEKERISCNANREVIDQIRPSILRISNRFQQEMEEMKKAVGSVPFEEPPRLPPSLREENLPVWLDWIETALGKFRGVLPNADQEQTLPSTVGGLVKQLMPKRRLYSAANQLVKPQDLPSPISLNMEEPAMNAPKRHGPAGLTAAQKADLLDEESEEEDFEKSPLFLKDIRLRAQQSLAKKRRRNNANRLAEQRTEDLSGSGGASSSAAATTTATPSRGPSRVATTTPGTGTGRGSPQSDAASTGHSHSRLSRRRSSASATSDDQDSEEDGSPAAPLTATNDTSGVQEEPDERVARPNGLKAALRAALEAHAAPAEEEMEGLFLTQYRMSSEELGVIAQRTGLRLESLCSLKQDFDSRDSERSGCVARDEFKAMVSELLGVGDHDADGPWAAALEDAVQQLDGEGTGEVEFFELCTWLAAG